MCMLSILLWDASCCYPSLWDLGSIICSSGSGVWDLGYGVQQLSNMLYYGSVCIHIHILYGVYSCIYTYIDTSAPCHPPADICRPQIGPDFQGFGVFSWMSCRVTCCYTYCNTYLHTPYAVHMCAYVCYVVYIMPSTVGCRPSPPPNPPWGTPHSTYSTHLHILYVCIYYMGYIGTYYTCATTC